MAKRVTQPSEPPVEATTQPPASESGKGRRSQRPFPAAPFEEAESFAKEIYDFGSGQPVRKLSFFNHISKSPESGASRQLITNAGKYGLIKGGYQAEQFELTDNGESLFSDVTTARERAKIRILLAVREIAPFNAVYLKFVSNKLPAKSALIDALRDAGVSSDLLDEALDTFVVNLRSVGLLQTLSGAERIVTEDHLLESLPSSPLRSYNEQFEHSTDEYLQPQQVGRPERGQAVVTSQQAHYQSTCFYITPIGEIGSEFRKHSDLFLESFIEPALKSFNLNVVRADKIDKPGVITRQIIDYILRSRLVVADLSFHNPNVFYELALRHAVRRPIIQVIRAGDSIPFDIQQMRTIIIDVSDIYSLVPKIDTYRSEISSQVRRALDTPDDVDTPISIYYPNFSATF